MASISRSNSPSIHVDEPSAKRIKLSHNISDGVDSNNVSVKDTKRRTLPYSDGLHLAPMVRIGTLPTRLVALEFGAELVWGPEIVDKAIIGCTRHVDLQTGVVTFQTSTSPPREIFRTHPFERPRLIFQLGSSDPELAVQAAKVIVNDVAGIGLNCGCPKPFSLSGGMGAALLQTPKKLCAILDALCTAFPTIPIDAKIRLLPSESETEDLLRLILKTSISALTIHLRYPPMRSSEPALFSLLPPLLSIIKKERPELHVIENGDCDNYEDAGEIRKKAGDGLEGIMIARGAEKNLSCFDKEGIKSNHEVVLPLFLRVAKMTNNNVANTKYIVGSAVLSAPKQKKHEIKQAVNKAKTYPELESAFGMGTEDGDALELETLLPKWTGRRRKMIEEEEAEQVQV